MYQIIGLFVQGDNGVQGIVRHEDQCLLREMGLRERGDLQFDAQQFPPNACRHASDSQAVSRAEARRFGRRFTFQFSGQGDARVG